eukprot:352361-Chlamydomonas_euryale.AAC.10
MARRNAACSCARGEPALTRRGARADKAGSPLTRRGPRFDAGYGAPAAVAGGLPAAAAGSTINALRGSAKTVAGASVAAGLVWLGGWCGWGASVAGGWCGWGAGVAGGLSVAGGLGFLAAGRPPPCNSHCKASRARRGSNDGDGDSGGVHPQSCNGDNVSGAVAVKAAAALLAARRRRLRRLACTAAALACSFCFSVAAALLAVAAVHAPAEQLCAVCGRLNVTARQLTADSQPSPTKACMLLGAGRRVQTRCFGV